ncbi:MAG: hypothetical protein P8X90_26015 [Desulfobacterales bacterium]
MSIIIKPVGLLRSFCKEKLDDQGRIELADMQGRSLEFICNKIGIPLNLISLFIVNGRAEKDTYRLHEGDEVKCVAVIGGG